MTNIQISDWNKQYKVTVISGMSEKKHTLPRMTILYGGQQRFNSEVAQKIKEAAHLFAMKIEPFEVKQAWETFKMRFRYLEPNDIIKSFKLVFDEMLPNSSKIYDNRHINKFNKTFSSTLKEYEKRVIHDRHKVYNAFINPPSNEDRYKPNNKDRMDSFFDFTYNKLKLFLSMPENENKQSFPQKLKMHAFVDSMAWAYDALKEESKIFQEAVNTEFGKKQANQMYFETLEAMQRDKLNEEKKKNPFAEAIAKLAPKQSMKEKALRITKCKTLERISFIWAKQGLTREEILA